MQKWIPWMLLALSAFCAAFCLKARRRRLVRPMVEDFDIR